MSEPAIVHPLIRIVDGVPRVVEDAWTVLEDGTEWDGAARRVLPLKQALAQSHRLQAAGPIGVWLAPSDEPAQVLGLLDSIALIGVLFPTFTDGRGYSTAALLRLRHGWRGELRAIGEVLQDQLFFLRRVGFDSFALRADRDPQQALRAFSTFSDSYQGAVVPDSPIYRRVGA